MQNFVQLRDFICALVNWEEAGRPIASISGISGDSLRRLEVLLVNMKASTSEVPQLKAVATVNAAMTMERNPSISAGSADCSRFS